MHDGPFTFTDGEIAEVRWVDRAELDALMATERFVPDNLALMLPLLHSGALISADPPISLCPVWVSVAPVRREEETSHDHVRREPRAARLARPLAKQQITSIEGVVSAVSSALGGTTWVGPARDQFEQDWNTTFRNALQQAQPGVRRRRQRLHRPQHRPPAGDGRSLKSVHPVIVDLYSEAMDVSVTELRAHLATWLDEVQEGDEITITDHGRPVARLVPAGCCCAASRTSPSAASSSPPDLR